MNKPKTCEHGPASAASAAGNSAKLREALQQAKVAIEAAKKKMGVENPIILEIIDGALAAPPRNCDKYTSLDEARNAYMAINEMPEGNRDEDMRQWLCDFHHWLLAPATEKEGGAK